MAESAHRVRCSVRAIIIADGKLLVQRPIGNSSACYAFIGGEYEVGDTFEQRLRREFEEETSARVVHVEYLFVVENAFRDGDSVHHAVEHFFAVELDRSVVESREAHLGQHWLPVDRLREFDVRPTVVRDAIASGDYRRHRHFVVERQEGPC